MRLQLPWRSRRGRGAEPGSSVRFARCVTRRGDRWELRRRLRSIAREVAAEQRHDVTLNLRRLAAQRVPLAGARPAVTGGEVVEFKDGTRFELDVREGEIAFERLANRKIGPVYLSGVTTIVGHCWYRLQFSSAWASRVEVLARVDRFESVGSRFARGSGRRGHPSDEQIGRAQP